MQTTKGVKCIDELGNERELITEIDQIEHLLSVITSLAAVSWNAIDSIASQGLAASMFRVGDQKRVTLSTGETLTFVILGFDHDDLTAGGKAKITFGMKNLMETQLPMNSSSANIGGWGSSVMRTSTMPDLLSKLPIDLQAVIKPVNKLTSAGDQSPIIVTSSDSLFLLSEIEARGTTSYSFAGEGTQYEYYQGGGNNDFIKNLSDGAGSAYYWWLRSPYINNFNTFTSIVPIGTLLAVGANTTRGVSFCFCI